MFILRFCKQTEIEDYNVRQTAEERTSNGRTDFKWTNRRQMDERTSHGQKEVIGTNRVHMDERTTSRTPYARCM